VVGERVRLARYHWRPRQTLWTYLIAAISGMLVALKNFLTLCVRGVAILVLMLEDNVSRSYAVPMAIGGLVGGYVGGMVSHRANRTVVRFIVIAVGFAASAYYFWKLYGPTVVRAGAE
jgi:uncharacterized membrane protein YfcA